MNGISWFRYVPHELVVEYFKLGWMHVADLGTPHGNYCALLEWPCQCERREPASTHTNTRQQNFT